MFIPTWILVILILMALPTVVFIGGMIDGEFRRHGRRIVGTTDDWREHGTYSIYHHLLYFRLRTENGHHSTALLD